MTVLNFLRNKIIRKFISLRELSVRNIPYDEIIRIELLVAMCISILLIGTAYLTIGLFLKISLNILLIYVIFFLIIIPSVLYLMKVGKHNLAKLIMMIIGSAFMFIKASALGRESGMNISMLIIFFGTFAFYSINDYKYIILSLMITTSLIVVLELTDYALLGVDSSTNEYEYQFNYISTILFCVLFFYVVLRVNQYMNTKLVFLNAKLIRKNSTLKKVNMELDSYVYRTSHDMRTPLTSLMGLIQLMKTEKNEAILEEMIQMQEVCVNKLDLQIEQIIHLSKNTKTSLSYVNIDFDVLLKDIFEEMYFFQKHKVLKTEITIQENIFFNSDQYRIRTILHNVLSNAFKYIDNEKKESFIKVDISSNEKTVCIVIRDNGIGIAADKISNIFNMFYRASNQNNGSGLGLYIVKEMVEKLGGKIEVHSIVNVQTEFIILLPKRN
jgi:signal transduction histidine kinase